MRGSSSRRWLGRRGGGGELGLEHHLMNGMELLYCADCSKYIYLDNFIFGAGGRGGKGGGAVVGGGT